GPALTTLRILRSDHGHGVVIRTGWAQAAGPIHAELFGGVGVTGIAGPPVPSFVMYNHSGASIRSHNVPMTDLSTVNSVTVWNNELGVSVDDVRFVSFETKGTIIVAMAPSSANPAVPSFYLKSTFGSGPGATAKEIVVSLLPAGAVSVGTRFHVVETHNRTLLFYYEVINALGISSVAYMAYTPIHDTYVDDLPFNAKGVVVSPFIAM